MALQSAVDVTGFQNALKVIYPQKRVNLLFYKDHPLSAMISVKDDFYGVDDALKVTVQHGVPSGGRSANYTNARSNVSTGREVRFSLTREEDFQIGQLTDEVIDASSKDLGALISVLRNKMDGAMRNLARNYALMLYGNGGGSRGAIGAIANGDGTNDRITLSNINDIVAFEPDMALYTDDNDGTGSSGNRGTTAFVGKVDRSNGYLYIVNAAGSAVDITMLAAAWSTTQYLFQEGDFGAVITGLKGWIPTSAPSSTAFFGVDRTTDSDRLGGTRYSGTSDPIEEAHKKLAARIHRNGGRPTRAVTNSIDWSDLELSLSSRVRYNDIKTSKAGIGFTGIELNTASGKTTIVSDPDCPQGFSWHLTLDTWAFHGLKGVPHQQMLNGGGRLMTLEGAVTGTSSPGVEFRQVYRGNLGNDGPGTNGVVTLPAGS